MSIHEEESCAQNTGAKDGQSRAAEIRKLNDRLRRCGYGGQTFVTQGILALPQGSLPTIAAAVREYSDFGPHTDPYDEHDFGSLTVGGEKIFWKIDYYDRSLQFGSPDPADPDVTSRVLTIFLASEY